MINAIEMTTIHRYSFFASYEDEDSVKSTDRLPWVATWAKRAVNHKALKVEVIDMETGEVLLHSNRTSGNHELYVSSEILRDYEG